MMRAYLRVQVKAAARFSLRRDKLVAYYEYSL